MRKKDFYQASEFEAQVKDWTGEPNKVNVQLPHSTTVEIMAFIGGMLMFRCQHCEKYRRALYPHPAGRGLCCSQCQERIAQAMPGIRE